MAKMNWDRVRDWDRMHSGMSEMEREDAREEAWLANFMEREAERAERSSTKASDRATRSASARKLTSAELAAALALSVPELKTARRAEQGVAKRFADQPTRQRLRLAAEHLGITESEVSHLRRVLNGSPEEITDRVRMTIRELAGAPIGDRHGQGADAKSEQRPKTPTKATPRSSDGRVPSQSSDPEAAPTMSTHKWAGSVFERRVVPNWTPETVVYVTSWGDKVHLTPACSGTKAFGQGGPVERVQLRAKICAARTACLRCFGEQHMTDELSSLNRLIARLHGQLDPNLTTRKEIAAKARMRFGAGAKSGTGGTSSQGEPTTGNRKRSKKKSR